MLERKTKASDPRQLGRIHSVACQCKADRIRSLDQVYRLGHQKDPPREHPVLYDMVGVRFERHWLKDHRYRYSQVYYYL